MFQFSPPADQLNFEQRLTKAYILLFGLMSSVLIFFFLIADFLIFGNAPEYLDILKNWRLFGAALGLPAVVVIYFLNDCRWFFPITVAIAYVFLAYTAYFSAPLGGVDQPWLHAVMLTPVLAIGFYLDLWPRILVTLSFPAVFMAAHILGRPETFSDQRLLVVAENTLYSGFVSIGAGALLTYVTRTSHRQQELLESLNLHLERKVEQRTAELLRLSESRDDILERERARVAKDLHDDLGQLLASLKLNLHMLKNDLPTGANASVIDQMQQTLSSVIQLLRDIIQNLQPVWRLDSGLCWALERLAEQINGSGGPEVQLEVRGDDTQLDPKIVLPVYRVVSEAITNALKHAEASKIIVHVEIGEQNCEILVIDDGKGITSENRDSGTGLMNMRERIQRIGGRFGLVSQAGGTSIHVIVPLRPAAP